MSKTVFPSDAIKQADFEDTVAVIEAFTDLGQAESRDVVLAVVNTIAELPYLRFNDVMRELRKEARRARVMCASRGGTVVSDMIKRHRRETEHATERLGRGDAAGLAIRSAG